MDHTDGASVDLDMLPFREVYTQVVVALHGQDLSIGGAASESVED